VPESSGNRHISEGSGNKPISEMLPVTGLAKGPVPCRPSCLAKD
jgi:hypothetical protein